MEFVCVYYSFFYCFNFDFKPLITKFPFWCYNARNLLEILFNGLYKDCLNIIVHTILCGDDNFYNHNFLSTVLVEADNDEYNYIYIHNYTYHIASNYCQFAINVWSRLVAGGNRIITKLNAGS